mmetsp:Transcript_45624/g.108153  ORF Transcript_45624/g.108153 Transcript_45624/m.108153 type:complete len:420 (+) Transcript_45624:2-1261(+)
MAVLVHGPQGAGKCAGVRAAAAVLGVDVVEASCASLALAGPKEKDAALQGVIDSAAACAPCLLLLRRVSYMVGQEANGEATNTNALAVFEEKMREKLQSKFTSGNNFQNQAVVVIASTDDIDDLDAQFRWHFTHELECPLPDLAQRRLLLPRLARRIQLHPDVSLESLAMKTAGKSPEDMLALLSGAESVAYQRILSEQQQQQQQRIEHPTHEREPRGHEPARSHAEADQQPLAHDHAPLQVRLSRLSVGAAVSATRGSAPPNVYGEACEPAILEDVEILQLIPQQRWAVVRSGSVTVILQDRPWAFLSAEDFDILLPELHPARPQLQCRNHHVGTDCSAVYDVVVVKLGIHVEDLCSDLQLGECMLVNTPGATTEPCPQRLNVDPQRHYPMNMALEWEAPVGARINRSRSLDSAAQPT